MTTKSLLLAGAVLAATLTQGCSGMAVSRRPPELRGLDQQAAADPRAALEAHRVAETRPGFGRIGGTWYRVKDLRTAALEAGADDAQRAFRAANTQRVLRKVVPLASVAAGAGVGMVYILGDALNDGPTGSTEATYNTALAVGTGLGLLAAAIEWPLFNRALARETQRGADLYNQALERRLKLSVIPRPGGAEAGLALRF